MRWTSDDVSLLDEPHILTSRVHGPRQLTDVYRRSLAVHHGGVLVTFDWFIAISAVSGARASSVVVL